MLFDATERHTAGSRCVCCYYRRRRFVALFLFRSHLECIILDLFTKDEIEIDIHKP